MVAQDEWSSKPGVAQDRFYCIYAYKNWSFLHTNNVLHLYRYHFTVTSVMVKMVKFKLLIPQLIIQFMLCSFMYALLMFTRTALITFIAHLKHFFVHYLYWYQQFQQEWPIYDYNKNMRVDFAAKHAYCVIYCLTIIPQISVFLSFCLSEFRFPRKPFARFVSNSTNVLPWTRRCAFYIWVCTDVFNL